MPDGPYRAHPDWTLASEHGVSAVYRVGFVVAALCGLGFIGSMVRSILFGPFAAAATSSFGVWLLLVFLVSLTLFFLFGAIRSSSGKIALHREGVVMTDLLGRVTALPWTEVKKVTRLHMSGGRSGPRFAGWSLHRGDGTSMVISTMYAGVGARIESMATERRIALEDEHR